MPAAAIWTVASHGQKSLDQVYAQEIIVSGPPHSGQPLLLMDQLKDRTLLRFFAKTMKQLPLPLVLLCMLLVVLQPCMAGATKEPSPEIKDIIVTTSDVDLLLFATVKNGFTPEMIDELHSGVPIIYTFFIELVKTSSSWLDTTLVESEVSHVLSYAPQQQEYRITFSNQKERVVTTKNLEQAQKLLAELNGVKVIALSQLIPDAPYAIHFKVVLKKGSLPLGMHNLLPFSSLWNFETDRRTIEFRY
jgi:hypothetical protein